MKYSTNYNLNLPELSDQFNLKHQNGNTEKIDTELKNNADAINSEANRATQKEEQIESSLNTEKSTTSSHVNNKNNPHEVTKKQVGLEKVENNSNAELMQMMFNIILPLGARIMRLPNETDPQTKWGKWSHWTKISTYNGMFPRVSGGTNTPTTYGKTGAEQLPNIKDTLLGSGFGIGAFAKQAKLTSDGVLTATSQNGSWISRGSSADGDGAKGIIFDASAKGTKKVYKDNGHVIPLNFGVELWYRDK